MPFDCWQRPIGRGGQPWDRVSLRCHGRHDRAGERSERLARRSAVARGQPRHEVAHGWTVLGRTVEGLGIPTSSALPGDVGHRAQIAEGGRVIRLHAVHTVPISAGISGILNVGGAEDLQPELQRPRIPQVVGSGSVERWQGGQSGCIPVGVDVSSRCPEDAGEPRRTRDPVRRSPGRSMYCRGSWSCGRRPNRGAGHGTPYG